VTMTAPAPRPRLLTVAFWFWVAGAVLLMLSGLMAATQSFDAVRKVAAKTVTDETVRNFINLNRGAGILCILLGVAIAYLAGRTRQGDKRFRRATVTLSLAVVALLVLCALVIGLPAPALLAALALIVAVVCATRPAANEWFDELETSGGGHE
jgi:ABC-type Fe3+ transport system permease subunit